MKPFAFEEARSVADACRLAREGATLKAGGTDLLALVKEGLAEPARVVGLRSIPGLALIDDDRGGLRIGALATLAAIAENPDVRKDYRALAQACAGAASPQIRNVATIGGNLLQRPRCWYFRSRHHECVRKGGHTCFAFAGENQHHAVFGQAGCAMVHPSTPATALAAFGARVEVATTQGVRAVPIERFFVRPEQDGRRETVLQPGELVTAVLLPDPRDVRSAHVRQGELAEFDWPIADVAVALRMASRGVCREARIAMGSVAPVPWRATRAEQLLANRRIDLAAAQAAGAAAIEGATPLNRNGYKLPVLEALVRRAVLAAAA